MKLNALFALVAFFGAVLFSYSTVNAQSEEKTKDYTGCVKCLDDTDAVNLPNNSKIVYMGHRRFLPKDHPYRRNRKDFNSTIEKRLAPKYRDGPAILRELNKLEVVFGKGDNAVAAPNGSVWKKKQFSRNYLTGHF